METAVEVKQEAVIKAEAVAEPMIVLAGEFDFQKHRQEWIDRLCAEYIKVGELYPKELFPHLQNDEFPAWASRIMDEMAQILFPEARLRKGVDLTPKRLGALIGHSCASGVWQLEWLQNQMHVALREDVRKKAETPSLSEKEWKVAESIARSHRQVLEVWYPALRRLAKRALCSAVDQTYGDMTDFLLGYSRAFARKPRSFKVGDWGGTTFELYFILLLSWPVVDKLRSVTELHSVLVKVLGQHRTGDKKRIEKICERIGLHYRKPGRPTKAKIIPTPS